jgi:hypothetical protein
LKRGEVDFEVHDKSEKNNCAASSSQLSHKSIPNTNTSNPITPQNNHPTLSKTTSKLSISSSLQNFSSRNIKHHTFDSGFQDVKNMEKNLISLLDDFHNGEHNNFL